MRKVVWLSIIIIFFVFFLYGCSLVDYKNIKWAKANGFHFLEISAPSGDWIEFEKFLNTFRANPNTVVIINVPMKHWMNVVTFFNVMPGPDQYSYRYFGGIKITVQAKQSDVRCFFLTPSIIFRMGDYPCINHEVGHLREYLEKIPYHSKYAY